MDAWVLEWLNLAVRWIHVIVGVAWIGTSFFFIWMENHLRPPKDGAADVHGELWLVHGGGFYHMKKFKSVPQGRDELHWFKWESYATWLSGFTLLAVIYYAGASTYLLPPGSPLSPAAGVAAGIGALAVSWLVYDRMCKSPLGNNNAALAAVGCLLAVALAFGLTQIFSGRGAFIHFGACLGTVMACNVFMNIIPAQRALLAAEARGETVDPTLGKKAGQRSLHNNYLTLPVIFTMISNHYPVTFGPAGNWLILLALAVIGGTVRHAFNLKNRGKPAPWLLPAAAVAMMALAFVASPRPAARPTVAAAEAGNAPGTFAVARAVVAARCAACHAAKPTHPDFDAPPNGVVFDTPADLVNWAPRIQARAVDSHDMPLGNQTGMLDEERAILGLWIAAGTPIPPNS